MLIIDSTSNNAYFNIALEEYLLFRYPTEVIFLLYINAPSIIVGKFQNTLAEVNLEYVKEKAIKVVRRMSGGGAVYHDLGNLNFSFHTKWNEKEFMDFTKFTEPVLQVLHQFGIPGRLEGRNDLLVDGRKFSGNAKLAKAGKMIQHGTILFDSDMSVLSDALKINPLKYRDKAVKSNRSRVINLREYVSAAVTIDHLKQALIDQMIVNNTEATIYELTEKDRNSVERLISEKYGTWDWNFGFSPNYSFKNAIKVPAGYIELHLDVLQGGIIDAVKIFGDFFASKPIEDLEEMFIGMNHNVDDIRFLLASIDLASYFGPVTIDEIIALFK
ncbi:lipoate--protein ligase [Sphingobacterium faecale]|uniref:lipoate--protein ligase n=1 Tax=Sphingobacterium faecale TaxID=2803775 RepID=A0ABS1R391_9SPHI|nr:lipoate--protein ligase [Sphingobacterium faecale]MBL1409175.1 lipoate--protein ligase [Sphingobacterium faecale]